MPHHDSAATATAIETCDHRASAVRPRRTMPSAITAITAGAVANVRPRQRHRQRGGGHDERDAGDEQACNACATIADGERHLGGVRSGNEVREADQINELGRRQPSAAADHLLFHQGEVRDWAAKSHHPEPEEQPGQFTQSGAPVGRGHAVVSSRYRASLKARHAPPLPVSCRLATAGRSGRLPMRRCVWRPLSPSPRARRDPSRRQPP
jgi:hypothetical protein